VRSGNSNSAREFPPVLSALSPETTSPGTALVFRGKSKTTLVALVTSARSKGSARTTRGFAIQSKKAGAARRNEQKLRANAHPPTNAAKAALAVSRLFRAASSFEALRDRPPRAQNSSCVSFSLIATALNDKDGVPRRAFCGKLARGRPHTGFAARRRTWLGCARRGKPDAPSPRNSLNWNAATTFCRKPCADQLA
jgi:hypothetical protein